MLSLQFDEHGRTTLDGIWEFYPGDHRREKLADRAAEEIPVPGLWEAHGYLDLDGVAWYRRRFLLRDAHGFWTLRFAAVMDLADVYLNGVLLGSHEHPFTPFELDATTALVDGENVLEVRVTDPPVDDPEHIRLAHGKQGWANHVFPSRPSLYLTYGGIWQSVTLRRHGPVLVRDVFVNGDPDDLAITVEVANVSEEAVDAQVGVRTLGFVYEDEQRLDARETCSVTWRVGAVDSPRWRPESPVLHHVLADTRVDGHLSDQRGQRYGLRGIRLSGERMFVNGEPYRMKSVLVQGFGADALYAEGTREEIVAEVRAARDMGFNTLRLHIKAFDPVYLDVCDELGMLLHCDLPIAEPIAHAELGDGTLLSRRAVQAITEQVRRDRNHPSIILWSAMNELGLDGPGSRETEAYEQFARTLYAAVRAADPTRPVIENDWVEPDPARVFASPILTAHWYGRLHADYLDKLERQSVRWAGTGRPLFVTEYGDWGLPDMPMLEDAPFWDTRAVYSAGLAATLWPATIARFVAETQRYQGMSDRLQTEVFRRHDHLGGYCLTELTDVPHELNGLLDLRRRPKPIAVDEVRRANQPVLPMLRLDSLVVMAGVVLRAPLHIANDGPGLAAVEVEFRFGDAAVLDAAAVPRSDGLSTAVEPPQPSGRSEVAVTVVGDLPPHAARYAGEMAIRAPLVPGSHDLLLRLLSHGRVVSENRYPIHVVCEPVAAHRVRVVGDGRTTEVLRDLGVIVGADGPTVIGQDCLDPATGELARARLAAGETVLVLAQQPAAEEHYPVGVRLAAVETAWGSSVFHFTTDSGALPSLPRRNVLVAEESTVQAESVVIEVDGAPFPEDPVVIAYKPVPGGITGCVVGAHSAGGGRLLLCQYRLAAPAARGDWAARALLADLVRWAAAPRAELRVERLTGRDGRGIISYAYPAPEDT
jgi:hypothetical protein